MILPHMFGHVVFSDIRASRLRQGTLVLEDGNRTARRSRFRTDRGFSNDFFRKSIPIRPLNGALRHQRNFNRSVPTNTGNSGRSQGGGSGGVRGELEPPLESAAESGRQKDVSEKGKGISERPPVTNQKRAAPAALEAPPGPVTYLLVSRDATRRSRFFWSARGYRSQKTLSPMNSI